MSRIDRPAPRHFSMIRGFHLADFITLGNAACGALSVFLAMAFMASGDDPDLGPYADPIRKALRNILVNQDPTTGHVHGPGHGSMYHHGFALLALSEAYGVVNEQMLWQGSEAPVEKRRTIGQALELAVRCAC